MPYEYSDPTRASEPHALPNVEVFWDDDDNGRNFDSEGEPVAPGWYYAFGFPGCLWDGEPSGPYATEAEALAAAREGCE